MNSQWLNLRRIQWRLGLCSLPLTTSLSLPFEHDRVSALPKQFTMSKPTSESNAPVLEYSTITDEAQMQVDLPEPADDRTVPAPVSRQPASEPGSTTTHAEETNLEDSEPTHAPSRPRTRVRHVSPRSLSEIKSSYELVSVVYGAVHGEFACLSRLSSPPVLVSHPSRSHLSSLPFLSLFPPVLVSRVSRVNVSRSQSLAPHLDLSRIPTPPYAHTHTYLSRTPEQHTSSCTNAQAYCTATSTRTPSSSSTGPLPSPSPLVLPSPNPLVLSSPGRHPEPLPPLSLRPRPRGVHPRPSPSPRRVRPVADTVRTARAKEKAARRARSSTLTCPTRPQRGATRVRGRTGGRTTAGCGCGGMDSTSS